MILSWLPFLGPGNPVVRFVNDLTDPLLNPIRKRISSMSAGIFDISTTIAFIFAIWALFMLSFFIQLALPRTGRPRHAGSRLCAPRRSIVCAASPTTGPARFPEIGYEGERYQCGDEAW